MSRSGRAATNVVLKDQELLLVTLDGETGTNTRTELTGSLGRLPMVRNAPDASLWLLQDASPSAVVRVVPTS